MTGELTIVAAQRIKAATAASDGGKPRFEPKLARELSQPCAAAAEDCIDDGYDLLIKCLRTGAVRGLRLVFVEGGPRILPLLESLYRAPTNQRALSRREAGILEK